MISSTSIGDNAQNLTVSPEYDPYAGVILHQARTRDGVDTTDEDIEYRWPRDLDVNNPGGLIYEASISIPANSSGATIDGETLAEQVYNRLRGRGFQYQPYKADSAYVDPAAEIGDGISIRGSVYSAIYKQSLSFGALMSSDISAPSQEEIDEEISYVPKSEREYRRKVKSLSSRITQTEGKIELEVQARLNGEESLRSTISQTAGAIRNEVSKKVDANSSGSAFGWNLTSDSWIVYTKSGSTSTDVLKATSGGLTVTGTINASSGTIGGFSIGSTVLSNWNGTTNTGLWMSTKADASGYVFYCGSKFKIKPDGSFVASSGDFTGKVKATSGSFTGKITASSGTIGGYTIGSVDLYCWDKKSDGNYKDTGVWIKGGDNPYIQVGSTKISSNGEIRVLKNPNGSATDANTLMKITKDGVLTADEGSVGSNFKLGGSGGYGAGSVGSWANSFNNAMLNKNYPDQIAANYFIAHKSISCAKGIASGGEVSCASLSVGAKGARWISFKDHDGVTQHVLGR